VTTVECGLSFSDHRGPSDRAIMHAESFRLPATENPARPTPRRPRGATIRLTRCRAAHDEGPDVCARTPPHRSGQTRTGTPLPQAIPTPCGARREEPPLARSLRHRPPAAVAAEVT
jgi:hypothetical protein